MINGTMSRPSSNAAGTRGALRALYMSDRVRRPRLQGPHPRYAPSMSRTRRFRVGLSSRLGSPAFGAGKWALRAGPHPRLPTVDLRELNGVRPCPRFRVPTFFLFSRRLGSLACLMRAGTIHNRESRFTTRHCAVEGTGRKSSPQCSPMRHRRDTRHLHRLVWSEYISGR